MDFETFSFTKLYSKISIDDLRTIYEPGYEFPNWITEDNINKYKKYTEVYIDYNYKYCEKDYFDVLVEREPSQFENAHFFYNKEKLKNLLGWDTSGYNKLFNSYGENMLPPNIAIYCKTPIKCDYNYTTANILNVIAYAFDSTEQPDYKYFIKNQDKFIDHLELIFNKIFLCSNKLNFSKIVLSMFGTGNFSLLFNHMTKLNKNVFQCYEEAFLNSYNKYKPYLKHVKEISFMGNNCLNLLKNFLENENIKCNTYGHIPQIIFEDDNIDNALYVNAWDPHTIAGNGNSNDNSLDGYLGRVSAIGPLTFPSTNCEMLKNINMIK